MLRCQEESAIKSQSQTELIRPPKNFSGRITVGIPSGLVGQDFSRHILWKNS